MWLLVAKTRLRFDPRTINGHVTVRQELLINKWRHRCVENLVLLKAVGKKANVERKKEKKKTQLFVLLCMLKKLRGEEFPSSCSHDFFNALYYPFGKVEKLAVCQCFAPRPFSSIRPNWNSPTATH